MGGLLAIIFSLIGGAVRQAREAETNDMLKGMLKVQVDELKLLIQLAGDLTEEQMQQRLNSLRSKHLEWEDIVEEHSRVGQE